MCKIKSLLSSFLLIFTTLFLCVPVLHAEMIKEVVFGLFLDAPSEVQAIRYPDSV